MSCVNTKTSLLIVRICKAEHAIRKRKKSFIPEGGIDSGVEARVGDKELSPVDGQTSVGLNLEW